MTTYLGKSCSFGLPQVPFVNCRQFMYLVISLLVLRAGCGIWLYQFLIIAYLFTLIRYPFAAGWTVSFPVFWPEQNSNLRPSTQQPSTLTTWSCQVVTWSYMYAQLQGWYTRVYAITVVRPWGSYFLNVSKFIKASLRHNYWGPTCISKVTIKIR